MSTRTAPRPSIKATREAILDDLCRDAVRSYRETLRALADAQEQFGDDDELDSLMCVVQQRRDDAGRHLVRVILRANGRDTDFSFGLEQYHWAGCGIRLGGDLYLAVPDPEVAEWVEVGKRDEKGRAVMKLLVIESASIADVGGLVSDGRRVFAVGDMRDLDPAGPAEAPRAPTVDPGDRDEPAEASDMRPGQPVPRGAFGGRKMPLARLTSTFVHPSDNWPVTLEAIVLAGACDGDHTAARADLPELQLAGWEDHEFGPLTLFVRVVVG